MDPSSPERALPWLHLTLLPGVSPRMQRTLLTVFGSPEAVVAAPPEACAPYIGEALADALHRGPPPALLQRTLRWLAHPGHHLVTLGDAAYPAMLLETADPPNAFYVRGNLEVLSRPAIAIVGSRNATPQGARDARSFAQGLSEAGFCIVSGLALGIDGAAHRGGLAGPGSSIAVMGTGPDRIYPSRNRELAEAIAAEGCLISEFALGTMPSSRNFPRRNRLISGLARGVLVVEAAKPSGSLITAGYALQQSREVFAIPGSIHSPVSKGCHALIQEGAKLVQTVDDILVELTGHAGPREETPIEPADTPLLAAMGFGPVSLDELARSSRIAVPQLGAEMSRLELRGLVSVLPDGRFQRVANRA